MRLKQMLLLVPLALLLSTGASPPAIRFALDTGASDVRAKVAFLGFASKTARFPDMTGSFAVSPANIEAVDMQVDIDARTLTTGDSQTKILRGKQFFDVSHYPALHFTGTQLHMAGGRAATVDGLLTARGITKPVRLDVTFSNDPFETGGTAPIELVARTTVDRTAFGMKAFPLIIGRMVTVTITARMLPLAG